ncbi:hypothetical protein FB45DRAFT_917836 [Roridomyces roridus]|uniref:GDP-fucose protein O-fucosyltransferase 2 n=1 Tax=Roridomyces roridus TaxID=1738132 RepID=A0AAD7FLX4_9AGAR|nr:hypothetical protein FB45DRAFT_917836 [Roridomyces roridus]
MLIWFRGSVLSIDGPLTLSSRNLEAKGSRVCASAVSLFHFPLTIIMDSKIIRQNLHSRQRFVWVIVLCATLTGLALFTLWHSDLSSQSQTLWFGRTKNTELQVIEPWDSIRAVNGPPTTSFRDNLRNDTKYITSWGSGGWSNDVITMMNLIYLGLITDRVPVIPPFLPSHLMLSTVGNEFSALNFGHVFDLPYLREKIGKPVLEWNELKALETGNRDEELGCWGVWQSIQYHDPAPRQSFGPWSLGLDVSYTKTPDWVKKLPNAEHDRYSTFWSLATLAFPSTRNESLVPPVPSPKHNATLPPDEHLLCFDMLYYLISAHESDELSKDYSPAWRSVGQYLRWTPTLERLAEVYIRQAFGLHQAADIPPFIAVHVRHTDFADWCEAGIDTNDCFAPLTAMAQRVQEVQDEIKETKGIEVKNVIITSDETNSTWWEGVYELGWARPDHSRTKELYGDWHFILIDAVIQSRSIGFVGTARSTVSLLSQKRVESWQDGAVRMVQWGKKGADAH